MEYFLAEATNGPGIFGTPAPSVGARVTFDPELMFAARERRLGHTVDHVLLGNEGLVIREDPRDEFSWPCRLWRVDDLDRPVKLQPTNRWMRCLAVTVLEELPAWRVFGSSGRDVAAVLEQARTLTQDTANSVASMLEHLDNPNQDWATYRVPEPRPREIGAAISHLLEAVDAAARTNAPQVFAWNPVDEVDFIADVGWQRARSAAAATMQAFNGSQIEQPSLRTWATAWTSVMGDPRGRS